LTWLSRFSQSAIERDVTLRVLQGFQRRDFRPCTNIYGRMWKNAIMIWPAPGSADTELGVLMEPEVSHGETEVYPRVQA
jgi:hypothetical protein